MSAQAEPITSTQWRDFFAACAANPLAGGARMRSEKELSWRLRGAACELCDEPLDRQSFHVVPIIPVALGGHAGFAKAWNAVRFAHRAAPLLMPCRASK